MATRGFVISGQSGFTLIEVMLAGAVATVIGLGVATMLTHQGKQIKDLRQYSSRDSIKNEMDREFSKFDSLVMSTGGRRVEAVVADPSHIPPILGVPALPFPRTDITTFLSNALAKNHELYDCVWATGDGVSRRCLGSTPTALYWKEFYFLPSKAGEADRKNAMGGPESTPGQVGDVSVRYDVNGRRCASTETQDACPLQMITSFQAICDQEDTTCDGAHWINLKYSFIHLKNGTAGPQLIDKSSTIQIDVKKGWDDSNNNGGGGGGGNNSSECPKGTVQLNASPLVCKDLTAVNCPSPKIFRVKSDRSDFECVSPLANNFPDSDPAGGWTGTSGGNPARGSCGPGRSVTQINDDGSVKCEAIATSCEMRPSAWVSLPAAPNPTVVTNSACMAGERVVSATVEAVDPGGPGACPGINLSDPRNVWHTVSIAVGLGSASATVFGDGPRRCARLNTVCCRGI